MTNLSDLVEELTRDLWDADYQRTAVIPTRALWKIQDLIDSEV